MKGAHQHKSMPSTVAVVPFGTGKNQVDTTCGGYTPLSVKFIDDNDIRFHFHISKKTLEREWHKNLPYIRVGKKTYYEESDLLNFLASHKVFPGKKNG